MSVYNWNPLDYNKNSTMQHKLASELIPKLYIKGFERILDIGCGDGKITAEIARSLPQGLVLGVDVSEDMIGFAKENFPPDAFRNLEFKVCNAVDLNFNNEFDYIVSFTTFHWIKDHVSALKGIKQSLKPNGKYLMQCGGKGNMKGLLAALEKITSNNEWSAYFEGFAFPWYFYGIEEYEAWLAEVGLHKIRLELVPKDITHKGREGLEGWIRTTWHPYIHKVPQSLQNVFIKEIVDEYIKDNPIDDQGLIHVPMMRLEVEAMK